MYNLKWFLKAYLFFGLLMTAIDTRAQQNVHPQSSAYMWPTDTRVKEKLEHYNFHMGYSYNISIKIDQDDNLIKSPNSFCVTFHLEDREKSLAYMKTGVITNPMKSFSLGYIGCTNQNEVKQGYGSLLLEKVLGFCDTQFPEFGMWSLTVYSEHSFTARTYARFGFRLDANSILLDHSYIKTIKSLHQNQIPDNWGEDDFLSAEAHYLLDSSKVSFVRMVRWKEQLEIPYIPKSTVTPLSFKIIYEALVKCRFSKEELIRRSIFLGFDKNIIDSFNYIPTAHIQKLVEKEEERYNLIERANNLGIYVCHRSKYLPLPMLERMIYEREKRIKDIEPFVKEAQLLGMSQKEIAEFASLPDDKINELLYKQKERNEELKIIRERAERLRLGDVFASLIDIFTIEEINKLLDRQEAKLKNNF